MINGVEIKYKIIKYTYQMSKYGYISILREIRAEKTILIYQKDQNSIYV